MFEDITPAVKVRLSLARDSAIHLARWGILVFIRPWIGCREKAQFTTDVAY